MGSDLVSPLRNPEIDDVADEYRLAATIFQLFVASDTASDTLANLKRLHGLMPYFVLKGILRATNPMAMIRGAYLNLSLLSLTTAIRCS